MARMPVPTLGMGTGVGPDLNETLGKTKGIMDSVRANVDADSVAKILRAAAGGGESGASSIPEGIGGLLQGVSGAFKGAIDVQSTLMQQLTKGGNGGGDSMMMMLVIISIMQQSNGVILQMMADARTQSDQRWEQAMAMMKEHNDDKIEDLRSRMGASPVDQWVHGDLVPGLVSAWTQNLNKSPLDQLGDIATALEKLQGVKGSLLGQVDEYSPGRLRWEEIQNDRLKITEETARQKEHATATRDFWKHMPAGVGKAAKELVTTLQQGLGTMGFGVLGHPMPGASRAADDALAEAGVG